jgi:hypothetical protein
VTKMELAELDLAVAIAEKKDNPSIQPETPFYDAHCEIDALGDDYDTGGQFTYRDSYEPSRDPVEAMRLMERYGVMVYPTYEIEHLPHKLMHWVAVTETGRYRDNRAGHIGETPCEAICRAVIALHASRTSAGTGL